MGALKWLGAALLVTWLILWLAVKIASGAIHLLLLIGLAFIVIGVFKSATKD
ncbi:MAG: hypothetical protein ABW136_06675 [Steroidobacteraceae bacterium]